MKKQFHLIKNIDSRALRYYLHKIEHLEFVNPEKLREVTELKGFRRTLILSEQEERIIEKYGKATNLLVNYAIYEGELNG